MVNSESATKECALVELPPRVPARLAGPGDEDAAALARHGLVAGAVIEVEAHAPLGGPLIVLTGRARLAIPRAIARRLIVTPLATMAPDQTPC